MTIRNVIMVTALLAGAPSAFAQGTIAPPGNSAVTQYVETIPAAGGNRPTQGGGHGAPGAGVPRPTAAALRRDGAVGVALLDLVKATGVSRARVGGKPRGEPAARPLSASSRQGRPSVESVLTRSITGARGGGGSMGAALPLLLALIAVGGMAVSIRRRPRST